jgi:hypothetical protein
LPAKIGGANERIVMTSQKQQVVDLLNAITTGAAEPLAVINPDKYIQHNLAAADLRPHPADLQLRQNR